MRMQLKYTLLPTVILAVGYWAGCAASPAQSHRAGAIQKYKMTTDIPPGIAAPEQVETRIGKLHFYDGFPDRATAEKCFDNLDCQRAGQAYLAALPAVSLEAIRRGLAGYGPANQTVLISETLMDSKSLFLTANDNTVYTVAWLDTTGGPLVIEVPPMVLGPMDDFWFRWVTDVGLTGPDKGQGGKYLLLPPGYKVEVPEGYFVARSRTYGNALFFRTFLKNGDPKLGVESVKKLFRVYPLAQAANPPAMKFVNFSDQFVNTIGPADFSAFEYVHHVIQTEPNDALDPDTLGLFAAIGIEKGKPFAPDARMKKILTDAAAVGDATVRSLCFRCRTKDAYYYPNSAWLTPFVGGSYKFEQNGVRLLDPYAFFFFYATGITPAMTEKIVGKGSQYAGAFVDAQGNPFDGGRTYRLHLPANIPAQDFWSIIIYDNQTRSMLQTDQPHPSVSSQTKGLLVNADSSVDVYFGPKTPAGKEHNWIQTVPGKGWTVLLRLYGPLEPWFTKTWRPGEIELVK